MCVNVQTWQKNNTIGNNIMGAISLKAIAGGWTEKLIYFRSLPRSTLSKLSMDAFGRGGSWERGRFLNNL
jgi:hypothetical protein